MSRKLRYAPEVQEKAVRLAMEHASEHGSREESILSLQQSPALVTAVAKGEYSSNVLGIPRANLVRGMRWKARNR